MFYEYKQNNSGGSFDFDEADGISYTVIIEAPTVGMANGRAHEIGIYFDGVRDGRDCGCCGDRWSEPWGDDGDEVPSHYGEPVDETTVWIDGMRWVGDKPHGFIHYLDGRVVPTLL